MPVTTLRGITWDHPRGYAVPESLAGDAAIPAVRWDRQPLTGFESHPVAELADRYDLLVVDHPGVADAAESGALLPMDALFDPAELAVWRAATVGSAFDSYTYAGRRWALPIDAAAQVCAYRPDLLTPDAVPSAWPAMRDLGVPFTLCLGGPHALLTVLAICVAAGAPPCRDGLLPVDTATRALDLLAELYAVADRELSLRDPITVLDAMAAGGDVAVCPLVYGYVTYNTAGGGRFRLAVQNAPRWSPGGAPGSVLGGTGIAVSTRTGDRVAARAVLRAMMSEQVQTRLAPEIGGQPSAVAAWRSPSVNARWNGFYRDTLDTVRAAWVRPRRPGWIACQTEASAIAREAIVAGGVSAAAVRGINERYRRIIR